MNKSIQIYVRDTLGLEMAPVFHLAEPPALPYFLNDAFDFFRTLIGGAEVVLAQPKVGMGERVSDVARKITSASQKLNAVVVYCPEVLASYERRNLIQSKIPFIVPGKQMYLPNMGIDLREHFLGQHVLKQEKLSPSTQGMLIFVLLNTPAQEEWSPAGVGAAMGYAPMTASRAIRELKQAGLMDVITAGRQKFLCKLFSPQETWQKALPLLRSPVEKTVYVSREVLDQWVPRCRLGGYSALAEWTMLSPPEIGTYAVPRQQFAGVEAGRVWGHIDETSGLLPVQIWRYETGILGNPPSVDPLSLWLSLRDDKDERVQLALAELMEKVRW